MNTLPHRSGIYKITCTANNRIYIGSAVSVKARWQSHCAYFRNGTHSNKHLMRAWEKYGQDAFVIEVIELCEREQLLDREQHYLDLLKPFDPIGFNIATNARIPALGRVLSDETKAKIGKAHTGKVNSPETRLKLSITHTGVKLPREQVEKIRAKNSGKKRTPEFSARLGERNRARGQSAETREKIGKLKSKSYVLTTPYGVEIEVFNLVKFCREHGLHSGHLGAVANGNEPHYKGWLCRHAD